MIKLIVHLSQIIFTPVVTKSIPFAALHLLFYVDDKRFILIMIMTRVNRTQKQYK